MKYRKSIFRLVWVGLMFCYFTYYTFNAEKDTMRLLAFLYTCLSILSLNDCIRQRYKNED